MYLLVFPGGTVKVTSAEQVMIDHLKANPLNEAHGFAGWSVELKNGDLKSVALKIGEHKDKKRTQGITNNRPTT